MQISLNEVLKKQYIFIEGKGGVGKSTLAEAIAYKISLASPNKKVLLIGFQDPKIPQTTIRTIHTSLDQLNLEPESAFEEYAAIKIGSKKLVQIFLQNKVIRYLVNTAPGVKELVMMGKVWNERLNYQHIIIDMPSTGHALTCFNAILNWSKLLGNSTLAKDAHEMLKTFNDTDISAHCIVAIPEETPLIEALEFEKKLLSILPKSHFAFIVNKICPIIELNSHQIVKVSEQYLHSRNQNEKENLKIFSDLKQYTLIPFIPSLKISTMSDLYL